MIRKVRNISKTALAAILWLLTGIAAAAQEDVEMVTDTLTLKVYFYKNDTQIFPDYRDNGIHLQEFRDRLEGYMSNPLTRIESLTITGSASPEGPYDNNVRLARERFGAEQIYLEAQVYAKSLYEKQGFWRKR